VSEVVNVRASSWGGLFDCAFRWEGVNLLKIRSPSGLPAVLGTAIHAGTAAFDGARVAGAPITPDAAADALVDALHHPRGDVDLTDAKMSLREAEFIGLRLHTQYCLEISPQYEFRSVEQTLAPFDIDAGNGITIRLSGTMDRSRVAVAKEYGLVIPDVKTGQRIVQKGEVQLTGKSAQIGAYQLMVEAETGLPTVGGQIIALPTTKSGHAQVSRIFDGKRVMLGTPEAPGLISIAAKLFKAGLFPPNPQSYICSPKYCPRWSTCPYHE